MTDRERIFFPVVDDIGFPVGLIHERDLKAIVYSDLPPLKWSSLRYDFHQEDMINGKDASYS